MHRQIAGTLTGRVTKWIVLAVGVLALLACAPFAAKLSDAQDNDSSAWLPGSAESTRALAELERFGDPEAITSTVLWSKDGGFSDADRQAIVDSASAVGEIEGVVGEVRPPTYSDDGEAATLDVTWSQGGDTFLEMPTFRDDVHELTDDAVDGSEVRVTGFGGIVADQAEAFSGGDTWLLLATLGIVIVILLITYRSPVMWVLPIFCSVVALFISQAVIYALATGAGLTVNGQAQFILTVLVIGAGTDYALLLVARYREELHHYEDRHEAMTHALHRAAPAILASAATVAVGMLCLMLAEMNSTAGLGPVLAIGVVFTVGTMLTLLPALLVICGRWVFWPRKPVYRESAIEESGFWSRIGRGIAPRPRRIWIGTAVALGACCLGLFALHPRGLSVEESFTDTDVESLQGQDVLAEHGLFDASNPVQVVARADRAQAVSDSLQGIAGVEGEIAPPVVQGDLALINAPISTDPYAEDSFDTVDRIRDVVHAVPGAEALVGGNSAVGLDTKVASARDNRVVVPVVLLMVLLILVLLLRAVTAPLLLIGTVVLSFGAALGLSALIFRVVFDYPATDAGFPLFAFVFLVALGIDYNIFLMTRVREETQLRGTREGSLVALSSTGGVITSAGIVLAATFVALGTLPLVFAHQIGIAVALGVLLDTLVVRSVLVTALNMDLGSRIWWPSRLDRGPHVVEPPAAGRRGETVAGRRTHAD